MMIDLFMAKPEVCTSALGIAGEGRKKQEEIMAVHQIHLALLAILLSIWFSWIFISIEKQMPCKYASRESRRRSAFC